MHGVPGLFESQEKYKHSCLRVFLLEFGYAKMGFDY